jgi:hypothetical protein
MQRFESRDFRPSVLHGSRAEILHMSCRAPLQQAISGDAAGDFPKLYAELVYHRCMDFFTAADVIAPMDSNRVYHPAFAGRSCGQA